jgi:hypothetical protein
VTDERPDLESPVLGGLLSGSSLKRRLLSGSIWAVAGRFGGAMVGIVIASLLTFVISPEEVGAYNLALSIVNASLMRTCMFLLRCVCMEKGRV